MPTFWLAGGMQWAPPVPACLVCRPARVWLGILAPANTDLNSRCECGTPVHICPSASPLQRFIAFRTLRTKS
jgi:hypothetical protein